MNIHHKIKYVNYYIMYFLVLVLASLAQSVTGIKSSVTVSYLLYPFNDSISPPITTFLFIYCIFAFPHHSQLFRIILGVIQCCCCSLPLLLLISTVSIFINF